jgi:predicted aconitase with swiveling domain
MSDAGREPVQRSFLALGLVPGTARGRALVLPEPLSFWGGVDSVSGRVIDGRHPQFGEALSGRVVLLPAGRGSSSSSSVLAETVRAGTAPAALVLLQTDPILVLGAVVAAELYGRVLPIVQVGEEAYRSIRSGDDVAVDAQVAGSAVVRVWPGVTP